MNSLTRIMSYDKTKIKNQESCNCEECKTNTRNFNILPNVLKFNQFPLTENEIQTIINLKYWYKDKKTKTFIWKALHVHGNKYDYSKTLYIKAREKVEIECENGHCFPQRPNDHLNGHGCLICSGHKKLTLEEFIKRANEIHGEGRYDYSEVNYTNINTKIYIICHNHEIPYKFQQLPSAHLLGQGCYICSHKLVHENQKLTIEEFIKRAREIHNDKYDYSKVKYVNYDTKITIICRNHSEPYEFEQTPRDHLDGHGCRKCSYEKIASIRRMTKEEFIERSNEIHGIGTYDYSKVEYINCDTDVIIICPIHSEFPQTPRDHLSGCGCRKCNKNKGEDRVRKFLTDRKIKFEEQKTFEDCKYINKLRFDFYLPKYNICIESDGIPHFKKVNWNGKMTDEEMEEKLKLNQLRDQIKNDYCEKNGINLLRIRYDENVEEKLTEYFQKHGIIKEQNLFEMVS